MSCGDFEDEVTAYVDGELPAARHAQVRAHLDACAECQATETLLRATVARMAELPAFEPASATRRAVLTKLDALPTPWWEQVKRGLRPAVLVPATGLAAVLAVSLFMMAPGQDSSLGMEDASVIELAANLELAEDYEVLGLDDMEDVEVVTRLHELEVVR